MRVAPEDVEAFLHCVRVFVAARATRRDPLVLTVLDRVDGGQKAGRATLRVGLSRLSPLAAADPVALPSLPQRAEVARRAGAPATGISGPTQPELASLRALVRDTARDAPVRIVTRRLGRDLRRLHGDLDLRPDPKPTL